MNAAVRGENYQHSVSSALPQQHGDVDRNALWEIEAEAESVSFSDCFNLVITSKI